MVFAVLVPPLLEKKYTPVATATAPAAPSPSSARREMRGPDGGGCWAGASPAPTFSDGWLVGEVAGGAGMKGEPALPGVPGAADVAWGLSCGAGLREDA